MKCPNCSKDASDDADECLNCGFILAKWRAAQAAGASGATMGSATAVEAPARVASGSEGVSMETLALFGLLLLAFGYYWFFERAGAPYSGPNRVVGRNECAFSGEVLDLYRLQPVGGVRVNLTPRAVAVTDADGKFFVKVKPGKPYAVELAHARFRPGYVEGFGRDWREAPWEQRVRAARPMVEAQAAADPAAPAAAPSARPAELDCDPGQERVFNFALVPLTVTGDEQAAIDKVP